MTPDSQKNKVIEVPDIDKLVPAMMKLLQQGRSSPSAEPQPTVEQPTPVAMAEHPSGEGGETPTVLSTQTRRPPKETKAADELATMIHDDLQKFEGCPRHGVQITVYGGKHWNAMLMFGTEAGPVPNVSELRALAQMITERLQNRYALAQ